MLTPVQIERRLRDIQISAEKAADKAEKAGLLGLAGFIEENIGQELNALRYTMSDKRGFINAPKVEKVVASE